MSRTTAKGSAVVAPLTTDRPPEPVLIAGQQWVRDRHEAARLAPQLVAQLRPNRDPSQATVRDLEAVHGALCERMADDGVIRADWQDVAHLARCRPGTEITPRQARTAARALVRAGLVARVADMPQGFVIVAPATPGGRLVSPPPKRPRPGPTRRERRAAKAAAEAQVADRA